MHSPAVVLPMGILVVVVVLVRLLEISPVVVLALAMVELEGLVNRVLLLQVLGDRVGAEVEKTMLLVQPVRRVVLWCVTLLLILQVKVQT